MVSNEKLIDIYKTDLEKIASKLKKFKGITLSKRNKKEDNRIILELLIQSDILESKILISIFSNNKQLLSCELKGKNKGTFIQNNSIEEKNGNQLFLYDLNQYYSLISKLYKKLIKNESIRTN